MNRLEIDLLRVFAGSALGCEASMNQAHPGSQSGVFVEAEPSQDRRAIYVSPERLAREITEHLEIRITVKTLANWRSAGKGPTPTKVGRHVRYNLRAIRTWITEQQQQHRRTA